MIEFTRKATMDDQRIADLFCGFVEGGVAAGWCAKVRFRLPREGEPGKFREVPYVRTWERPTEFFGNPGWEVHVWDDEGKRHKITNDDLKRALEDPRIAHDVLEMLDENDDANTHDNIVQTAALGEIVYG